MVDKNYYQRLKIWQNLRQSLEQSKQPYEDAINFFDEIPTASLAVDPYNETTWPNPWLLIEENVYCRFLKLLGICYSLQLTDRFSTRDFEIHIGIDSENNDLVYKIKIDNESISSYNDKYILNKEGEINQHSVIKMPKLN